MNGGDKITPPAFTGATYNDYAPTDLSTAYMIDQACTGSVDSYITGLAAQATGTIIVFRNTGMTDQEYIKFGANFGELAKGAPSRRFDQTIAFQLLDRKGDAWATCPEHGRYKFMRERQFVSIDAVMGHQDPACQSLGYGVAAIRQSGVGELNSFVLLVTHHQGHERFASMQRFSEGNGVDLPACTGNLHIGAQGNPVLTGIQHEVGRALEAKGADLDHPFGGGQSNARAPGCSQDSKEVVIGQGIRRR